MKIVPSRFESSWNFSRFCCQRLAGDRARQLYSGRAIFLSNLTFADSMCRHMWLRDIELTTKTQCLHHSSKTHYHQHICHAVTQLDHKFHPIPWFQVYFLYYQSDINCLYLMQILHSFKALITTHIVQKKVEQKC